jgi:hypothetical protein
MENESSGMENLSNMLGNLNISGAADPGGSVATRAVIRDGLPILAAGRGLHRELRNERARREADLAARFQRVTFMNQLDIPANLYFISDDGRSNLLAYLVPNQSATYDTYEGSRFFWSAPPDPLGDRFAAANRGRVMTMGMPRTGPIVRTSLRPDVYDNPDLEPPGAPKVYGISDTQLPPDVKMLINEINNLIRDENLYCTVSLGIDDPAVFFKFIQRDMFETGPGEYIVNNITENDGEIFVSKSLALDRRFGNQLGIELMGLMKAIWVQLRDHGFVSGTQNF